MMHKKNWVAPLSGLKWDRIFEAGRLFAEKRFSRLFLLLAVSAFSAVLVWGYFRSVQPGRAADVEGLSSPQNSPIISEVFSERPDRSDLNPLADNPDKFLLEFITPDFKIVQSEADDGPCQIIEIPGYSEAGDPGEPRLPVHGAMLGIPPEGEPVLRVLDAQPKIIAGAYQLCPGAEPIIDFEGGGPPRTTGYRAVRSPETYAASEFLPSEPAELVSTGFIRSQRTATISLHPFQYNPATGELRYYPRIAVQVEFPGATNLSRRSLNGLDEGVFEDVLQASLLNYETAKAWRAVPGMIPETENKDRLHSQSPSIPAFPEDAYKVIIEESGVYSLTYAELLAAGFPVDDVDPRNLHLYWKDSEVAIEVEGEDDGIFNTSDVIYFYAQEHKTKFSEQNVYWLTWDATTGARISNFLAEPVNSYPTPSSFTETVHLEKNIFYQSRKSSDNGRDYWYWRYLLPTSALSTRTFTTTLDYVADEPVNAMLRGGFYGEFGIPKHRALVSVNGSQVSDFSWSGGTPKEFEASFNQSLLMDTNTITIALPMTGQVENTFWVNWFEFIYQRLYQTHQDELEFTVEPGSWQVQVGGFSHDEIQVFDITAPDQPNKLVGSLIQPQDSEFQAVFEQTLSNAHKYYAFTPEKIRAPVSISLDRRSDLKDLQNGADYIVISYGDFITDVMPLANYRAVQGLRVKVVDLEDVYDEFNGGMVDPEAVRNFLAYAYANWQPPAPMYVLLVGDGHYDFLNYRGTNAPNLFPPYLAHVDHYMGETAADNRFVSVSGDDYLPDMAIGRLPVNTITETQAIVGKILEYENDTLPVEWKKKTTFLADNKDAAGDFAAFSDSIANFELPASYQKEKIYFKVNYSTIEAARSALIAGINEGRLLVSFIGHSAVNFWMHEIILKSTHLPLFSNAGKYPFFIPMTCLEGYFIWPNFPTENYTALAEEMVLPRNKGAIASFSASGQGVATGHDLLERGLFRAIFKDYKDRLGLAAMQAKLFLYASAGGHYFDLVETYHLFGDPATRLKLQRPDVTISKTGEQGIMNQAGNTVNYRLMYTNTGEGPATHLLISDTLPSEMFNPAVSTSAYSFTLVSTDPFLMKLPDLPPGESEQITITGNVPSGFTGWLSNAAEIQSAGELTESQADNRAENLLEIVELHPDVTISKTSSQGFLMDDGYPVTYLLTYTNIGPGTATNLTISDTLPAILENPIVSTSAFSYTQISAEPLILKMPDLLPGDSEVITITGTVSETFLGWISNAATIQSDGEEPGTQADNRAENLLEIVELRPDVTISKTGEQGVMDEDGIQVTYRLNYTNTGTGPTRNLIISDTLPAEFKNPIVTTDAFSYTQLSADPLRLQLSELMPGESGWVTITGSVDETFLGWLSNTAEVQTSDELAEAQEDNRAENDLEILFLPPDVSIAKEAGQGIRSDSRYPITYWITYTNHGGGTATNVIISDTLPAEFKNPIVTTSAYTYTQLSADPLRLQMPNLLPGFSERITITGSVEDSYEGWITNTVSAESYGEEASTLTDNRAEAALELLRNRPDLTIWKTGEQGLTDGNGTEVTYRLVYTNTGSGTAANVIISDTLPVYFLHPIISTSAFSYTQLSAEPLVLQMPDLEPGGREVVTITDKITGEFEGWLVNAATVHGSNEIPASMHDNRSEAMVEIRLSRPDLAIIKEGVQDYLNEAGEYPVTYWMTYTNNGSATATQITISDTLPALLMNPIVSSSAHTMTIVSEHPLILRVSDLAPGENQEVTVSGVIAGSYQGWVSNTAIIETPDELSALKMDNRAENLLEIVELRPDVTISKTGEQGVMDEDGIQVTYRLNYTNTGTGPTRNLIISDTLPTEFKNPIVTTDAFSYTQLSADPLRLQLSELMPGESGWVTITGRVNGTFRGWLINAVTIQSEDELVSNGFDNRSESLLEIIIRLLFLPITVR